MMEYVHVFSGECLPVLWPCLRGCVRYGVCCVPDELSDDWGGVTMPACLQPVWRVGGRWIELWEYTRKLKPFSFQIWCCTHFTTSTLPHVLHYLNYLWFVAGTDRQYFEQATASPQQFLIGVESHDAHQIDRSTTSQDDQLHVYTMYMHMNELTAEVHTHGWVIVDFLGWIYNMYCLHISV